MNKVKENINPIIPLTIVGGIAVVGGIAFWLNKKKSISYTPPYTQPPYTTPPPLYTEPKKPTFVQKIKNIFKPKTKALTNVLIRGKQYLKNLPSLKKTGRFPRTLQELQLWNQTKLQELKKPFYSKIATLLIRAKREQGIDLIIMAAYRTPEKQDSLYKEGKVTKIPPFIGGHNFGFGADLLPWFKDSWRFAKKGTKYRKYNIYDQWDKYPKYRAIANVIGGFNKLITWDPGHFELANSIKNQYAFYTELKKISKQEYGLA